MPLNIDLQQILLHLLNFVILGGGLYFLLYKPIRNFMEQREKHYASMEDQAKLTMAEADQLRDTYARKLSEADEELGQMRKEAEEELAKERIHMEEENKKNAEALKEKAIQEAEMERDKMLYQARKEIRGLAEDAAERLARQQLNELYDEFLDTAEGKDK